MYIVPFAFNFIEWVRDNILEPFIEIVAGIVIDLLMIKVKMLMVRLLSKLLMLLYLIYAAALKVVDLSQSIFDALSGVEKVSYNIDGNKGSDYFTNVLLQIPLVKNVFWSIWIMSVVLCVVFTIASIIRSISDLDDTGQSVGDVLRQSAGTMGMFLVLQVVTYMVVAISNYTLTSTQTAMRYAIGTDTEVRLSNAIFAASAINAGRTGDPLKDTFEMLDIVSSSTTLKNIGVTKLDNSKDKYHPDWDKVKDFYSGRAKYYDIIDVEQRLVLSKIDYLSALICTLFVLKYMLGAAVSFIHRALAVVVAYLTAPFFVALSPLDGGNRFERWKNFFTGACFGAMGTVISVNVYMMILPVFLRSNVIYDGPNGLMVYLIRLYSVVILSIGFEKLGNVVNEIISDSGIMSPSEGFRLAKELADKLKSAGNFGKKSGGGGKGK